MGSSCLLRLDSSRRARRSEITSGSDRRRRTSSYSFSRSASRSSISKFRLRGAPVVGNRCDLGRLPQPGGQGAQQRVVVTLGHDDQQAGTAGVGEPGVGSDRYKIDVDAGGAHNQQWLALGVDAGGGGRGGPAEVVAFDR